MTSESGGDASAGSGGPSESGGERRRITRAYYASEGDQPQAGYGQQGYGQQGYAQQPGYDQYGQDQHAQRQYGDQRSGQPGYDQQYGDQQYRQPGYGPQPGYQQDSGQQDSGQRGHDESGWGQPPGSAYGGGHAGRRPSGGGGGKRRRNTLIAIVSGALAVIVVAVVVLVIKPGKPGGGFIPSGSSPGQDAEQITTAFLQAWQSGDLGKAAGLTDDPTAAQAALSAYAKDLNLKKLSGSVTSEAGTSAPAAPTPKPTTGAAASTTLQKVTFQLNADVAAPASADSKPLSGSWSYHSTLVAYQGYNTNGWYIQWQPSVVAPNLTASQHLATVTVAPQVISVTDSGGGPLTSYNDPGLNNISSDLVKKAPAGQGSPGLSVQIENAAGKAVPNSQAVVVSPSNIGELATTIDPQAEQAAQAAVKAKTGSAMVVIQPSTGKILAIANNAGQHDYALTAAVAPGSDFKIITSTALFNSGLTTASSPVACPPALTVQGTTFHNDQGESEPASTPFSYDFAQSCNNAFTQWWPHMYGKLASTAKDYYGLNQPWDIGISGQSASYFNAPATASGAELAQEDFGQGELTACPLAMASVAATVDTGQFHQPILVEGTKTVSAQPLPSSTDSQLKTMMRDVVTQGTAAGVGFGPDVYAKTGTADIIGQEAPNAWLVAFDPSKDVAVAAMVLNSGYGASVAAPEVKTFLDQY